MTVYRDWGKRGLDLLVLAIVSPIAVPVVGIVALVLRIKMGSPILFRQLRPGYQSKPFTVLKFRTMTSDRDENGLLLPDDKRLTKLGTFLRRLSLDELPQLWNVLKGEMSLVGPRPLLMQYIGRYSPEQARRHDVRPGITGWAQVNGRNAVSWEEKLRLDVWYVDHCGLGVDIKIFAMTMKKLVLREGISHGGHATMPEFKGSQQV